MDAFQIIKNNNAEETYQFSEELGQDNDIQMLKEFYNEIKDSKDPRHRLVKIQCRLKIKSMERLKKKDKFIW
jgi:uncharacterized protein (UPF0248 family)